MAKAQPVSGLNPDKPILECSALILHTRLGEMLNYEPYIDDVEKVFELHQMRIAAKRLRYSLEIFLPVYCDYSPFGKEFEEVTEEIKALQEHLGEIHDADVLVPKLTEHQAKMLKGGYGKDKHGVPFAGVHHVDYDACQGLLTLCRTIQAERDKRYQMLLKDWKRLRRTQFFEKLVALLDKTATEPSESPETRAGAVLSVTEAQP